MYIASEGGSSNYFISLDGWTTHEATRFKCLKKLVEKLPRGCWAYIYEDLGEVKRCLGRYYKIREEKFDRENVREFNYSAYKKLMGQ